MNERINELAVQAKAHADYYAMLSDEPEQEIFTKKFAELIIKACRDVVARTRDQAIEGEWNIEEAMSTAMFDIEEHFGVE
jgi:hypothetical protein